MTGLGTDLADGPTGRRDFGEVSDVIRALVLFQGTIGVLASFGMIGLMGSPVYVLMPLIKLAMLVLFAAKAAGGRRWAVITLIAIQAAGLAGYGVSTAIGLIWLGPTLNLVGLLTSVALPVAIIWLCTRLLPATRRPTPDEPGCPPPPVAHSCGSSGRALAYIGPIEPPR